MNNTLPLGEGQSLTFDSIEGTARHDPNLLILARTDARATLGKSVVRIRG